jgi:hypothetical protein
MGNKTGGGGTGSATWRVVIRRATIRQLILEKASENVKYAVIALGIEIVALTAAIPVTLLT